jgi:hypothetical protein
LLGCPHLRNFGAFRPLHAGNRLAADAGVRHIAFDTLACAKHLEQAGVDRTQAEAMNQYLRPDLATKADIATVQQDIAALRQEMKAEIAGFENRFLTAISSLESRINQREMRLVGVMAVMLGILFALLKFTP